MGLKETLKVMIVDDMAISRALIAQSLDEIGIKNYTTESDSRAALGKLVANPVHLVISDMNMPGISGLQLLEGLRHARNTQRIGFILITGSPTPEVVKAGHGLGLNNMVRKPFNTVTLRSAIETVVGRL